MNSVDRLVLMANQIAANLGNEPDPVAAAANHIRLYWDPRMKAGIKGYDGAELTPTAKAAVGQL